MYEKPDPPASCARTCLVPLRAAVPGVCVPVNQTIPARSMWYWCGLASTHRTVYTITSRSTNNLTTMFLMRQDELEVATGTGGT